MVGLKSIFLASVIGALVFGLFGSHFWLGAVYVFIVGMIVESIYFFIARCVK